MQILTVGKINAGFTLIELIVVTLLISLSLTLVAGVNFNQRNSLLVRSTARQLYSYFMAARSQAILTGQVNRCWYLPDKQELVTQIRHRTIILPEAVTLVQHDAPPAHDIHAQVQLIYYYPDGSAGGGDFCLHSKNQSIMLRVDPLLGFVTVLPNCDELPTG